MLGSSSSVKPTLAIMPTHWHQAFIAAELYSDSWIGIHSESAKEPFYSSDWPRTTVNQRKQRDKGREGDQILRGEAKPKGGILYPIKVASFPILT